jgi:predicted ribosomally synthesized peptide with SipW-like signal peptide
VSTRTVKKLLLSLIAIGALASITTGGTYALFNSESENVASSIQTGKLSMTETIGSGPNNNATCTSSDKSWNSNATCLALFTTASLNYPGTTATVKVSFTNPAGNQDGYDLSVSMPSGSCSSSTTPSATITGGGNPCASGGDFLWIEETNSSGTAIHCWYPAGGTSCSDPGSGTLYNFSQSYGYAPTAPPEGSNNGGNLLDISWDGSKQYALTAGSTRYFLIGIQEGTSNTLQGETATFPLLFHLEGSLPHT